MYDTKAASANLIRYSYERGKDSLMSRTASRIPSLDGLRAIAISLVFIGHAATRTPEDSRFFFLWVYANFGVQIFFVISGYLITTLLLKERDRTGGISLADFYRRRAYRILPAAYAFILTILLLQWHALTKWDVSSSLLYLLNYNSGRPWNLGHLWSLSVEEQFYLLWPLTLALFFRNRVKILAAVFLATPFVNLALRYFHLQKGLGLWFPSTADGLAIGCLLAIAEPRLAQMKWLRSRWMLLLILLVALYPLYAPTGTMEKIANVVILTPLVRVATAIAIFHVTRCPYWILNCAPMVWLGALSYSLYLWQQPIWEAPKLFPLAILAAIICHYSIERPMLSLRDRKKQFGSSPSLSQTTP
jgi:peptidoglycan/LPS O-acetylase OafA/YrhL